MSVPLHANRNTSIFNLMNKTDIIRRVFFIAGITIVALAAFSLWHGQSGGEDGHDHDAESAHVEDEEHQNISLTQQQVNAVDLRMDIAKTRELDATLKATGALVLRPQDQGEVASLMGGIVKSLLVKDGQRVSRGQVVATIENTDVVSLQREYYSAYKESEMSRMELERQRQLSSNGAGVGKNLQLAEKNYQTARANMVGIARQLSQLGIGTAAAAKGHFTTVFPLRAPMSGTVSQVTASIGSYADMQTPLMKICDNNALECDLNVFEKDLGKVKNGDRVRMELANQPNVTLTGKVYGMNQYFNDGTKSVAVHVKLDNAKGARLIDGMYVSGLIATGRQECKTLPTDAIVSSEGKTYVFALNKTPKNGKFEFSRHEVTTGVSQGGYTEVALCEHIQKDQKIVTESASYLASMTTDHGEHNH